MVTNMKVLYWLTVHHCSFKNLINLTWTQICRKRRVLELPDKKTCTVSHLENNNVVKTFPGVSQKNNVTPAFQTQPMFSTGSVALHSRNWMSRITSLLLLCRPLQEASETSMWTSHSGWKHSSRSEDQKQKQFALDVITLFWEMPAVHICLLYLKKYDISWWKNWVEALNELRMG